MGDAPAIMQLMFQQSKIKLVVPHVQFFARAAAVPAARRFLGAFSSVPRQSGGLSSCMQILVRTVQNCAADRGDLTGPVLGLVADAPVVVQRKVLGCAMLGSTVDTYSASVRGGLHGRIPHIFYVKVELWILRSILVSSLQRGRRGSGRARRLHGSGLHSIGFAGEIPPRAVFPVSAARSVCTR